MENPWTVKIAGFALWVRKHIKLRMAATAVGAPGIGKTEVTVAACRELVPGFDPRRHVFRVAGWSPVDAHGVPHVFVNDHGDKVSDWAPPAFLPQGTSYDAPQWPGGMLVLDELAQAPQDVQSGCLKLNDNLPANWGVIALGNKPGQNAGANRVVATWSSRGGWLEVEPDLEAWLQWAAVAGIDARITSFLGMCPKMFCDWDFKKDGPQPNPRSWSLLSRFLDGEKGFPPSDPCSYVGDAGVQFTSYCEVFDRLPDIPTLVDNPLTMDIPEAASVCHAIIGATIAEARKRGCDQTTLGNLAALYQRLPMEMGILAFSALKGLYPDMATRDRNFRQWAVKVGRVAAGD